MINVSHPKENMTEKKLAEEKKNEGMHKVEHNDTVDEDVKNKRRRKNTVDGTIQDIDVYSARDTARRVYPCAVIDGGRTSKSGQTHLIGNFGEGMKVAFAVLLRAGCNIMVKTRLYTTMVFQFDGQVRSSHS